MNNNNADNNFLFTCMSEKPQEIFPTNIKKKKKKPTLIIGDLQTEGVELLGGVVILLLERLVALVASFQSDFGVFGTGGGIFVFRGKLHALGGQQFGHKAHALLVALQFAERLVVGLVQHVVHLFLEQRERERAHPISLFTILK